MGDHGMLSAISITAKNALEVLLLYQQSKPPWAGDVAPSELGAEFSLSINTMLLCFSGGLLANGENHNPPEFYAALSQGILRSLRNSYAIKEVAPSENKVFIHIHTKT